MIPFTKSKVNTLWKNNEKIHPFQQKPNIQSLLKYSKNSNTLVRMDLNGGACDDSDPILFLKIGLSAAIETAALVGIIVGSTRLSSIESIKIPSISGLSLIQWACLFIVIFFPSIIGSIIDGGLSAASQQILMPNMNPGDPDWYANLKKPSWNPPGWLFPIMWLIVSKPTQLVAVSIILKESLLDTKMIGLLTIYCSQLALGDAWNKVFFGLQCPGRGAAVITTFYGVLLTTAYLFGTVNANAGYFMIPTCLWVTVATALNWNIYLNN